VQGVENCTCYQVQPRSLAGPLTSRCSTADCRDFRLNPAGPALPGITGCKREVCTPSPAPVRRAPRSPNTCRTGMMPRPFATEVTNSCRRNPRPLHHSASPVDVAHDERAARFDTLRSRKSNENFVRPRKLGQGIESSGASGAKHFQWHGHDMAHATKKTVFDSRLPRTFNRPCMTPR
jgi:hypothetical protein